MKNPGEFVDFSVIKEKIIKTDRVLHMYSELKIKNELLEKTLEETQKKYKQSIDDLTVLNLEKSHNSHQFEEVKNASEKFRTENEKLNQELKISQDDYNRNIHDLQNLQLKYQSICMELEECQNSLKQYQSVCSEDSVKKGRKQQKRRTRKDASSPRKNWESECSNESDEGSEISNIYSNECSELKKSPSPNKQECNPNSVDAVSNNVIYIKVPNSSTEIDSLKNVILGLEEEVKKVTEEKFSLNEEWNKKVQKMEIEWSKSRAVLIMEREELREKLKKYENEQMEILEERKLDVSVDNCINQMISNKLQSLPMIMDEEELEPSNAPIDQQTNLDTEIDCTDSDSESVLGDIDAIFKEMKMHSPLSPLSQDQVSVMTDMTNLHEELPSGCNESSTMTTSETSCINGITSESYHNESSILIQNEIIRENVIISESYENQPYILNNNEKNCDIESITKPHQKDKYEQHRKLKAKKLNSLLNIRRAKQKLWLHKSNEILNSKRKKRIEEAAIQYPNIHCNDFINTFVHILNQKLSNSKSRRSNKSRNILEINRMLREKAKCKSSDNFCYSPSLDTDYTSINSLSCKSGDDSCYESLLSNPPSNEMSNVNRENNCNEYSQPLKSLQSELRRDDLGDEINNCVDLDIRNDLSGVNEASECSEHCQSSVKEINWSAENKGQIVDLHHSEYERELNENNGSVYADLVISNCDEQPTEIINGDKIEIAEGCERSRARENYDSVEKMEIEAIKSEIISAAANIGVPENEEHILTSDKLALFQESSSDLEDNLNKIITSESNNWSDTSLSECEGTHELLLSQENGILMENLMADSHNMYLKNVQNNLWSSSSNIESTDQHEGTAAKESMLAVFEQEKIFKSDNELEQGEKSNYEDQQNEKKQNLNHIFVSEDSVTSKEPITQGNMEKPTEISINSHPGDNISHKNEKDQSKEVFSLSVNLITDQQVTIEQNNEVSISVSDLNSIETTTNQDSITKIQKVDELNDNIHAEVDQDNSEKISTPKQINNVECFTESDSTEIHQNSENSIHKTETEIECPFKSECQEDVSEDSNHEKKIVEDRNNDSVDFKTDENRFTDYNFPIVIGECEQKIISESIEEKNLQIPSTNSVDSIVSEPINHESESDNKTIPEISTRNSENSRISKRLHSKSDKNPVNVKKKKLETVSGESVDDGNSTSDFHSDENIHNLNHVDLMSDLSDSSDDHKILVSEHSTSQQNLPAKQKVNATKKAVLMRRSIRIYKQRNAATNSLGNNESILKDNSISSQRKTRKSIKITNNCMKTNFRRDSSLHKPQLKQNSSSSSYSGQSRTSLQCNNSNARLILEQHEKIPVRKAKIEKWDRGKCLNDEFVDGVEKIINSNGENINISKRSNIHEHKNINNKSEDENQISSRIGNKIMENTYPRKLHEEQKASNQKKVNIIQHILLQPANTCDKPNIKTPLPQRLGGFKRPNNSKIVLSTPLSPPMPSVEEAQLPQEPVIIPLEKPPKLEPRDASDLFRKLITFSSEEKTVEEVARHFSNQETDHIANLILGHVIQDNEKADKKHSHAPLMTDTQRVMLGFMLKLEQKNVKNLLNTYLEHSELRLFRAKTLQEVETITRLHVAICKSHKHIHRMRRTCCDAFYFMGDLAIPFFFIVLVSWIEILPLEEHSNDFPLIKVLIQLVNLKTCNIPGYNLLPLRDLLNKYYNYPREPWINDKFFDELLATYFKNPVKPADYPLLLYCKNNKSKWVFQKIDTILKPTLSKIKGENFKATVIILISEIVSQFNGKTDGEYIALIKEWFTSLLQEVDTPEVVKRSLILGLRKLPKFHVKKPIPECAVK